MPLGVVDGDKHKHKASPSSSSSARHGHGVGGRRSASKGHRAGRSSISVDPESAGPALSVGRRADSDDAQAVRARSSSQAVELKAEFEQMLQRFEHDKTAWDVREKELVDYTNKLKMIKGGKAAAAAAASSANTTPAAAGSKTDGDDAAGDKQQDV